MALWHSVEPCDVSRQHSTACARMSEAQYAWHGVYISSRPVGYRVFWDTIGEVFHSLTHTQGVLAKGSRSRAPMQRLQKSEAQPATTRDICFHSVDETLTIERAYLYGVLMSLVTRVI